eukprot:1159355-Pelagomonas_calceolata.AAC.3
MIQQKIEGSRESMGRSLHVTTAVSTHYILRAAFAFVRRSEQQSSIQLQNTNCAVPHLQV